MTASLKSTSEGQTLVLTLSNPEHKNALGPEMYIAGIEALNAAENNPDVRSVVLTGEGNVFCAGGNLHRLLAGREQPADVQGQSLDALHSWIDSIRTFPKPVIAAVEGAAAGAGFSLVLACDFVVAADDAVFVMAYSNVGLSPDGGASWSLARALPRPVVNDMLMRGTRVKAAQLQQAGLINELTPNGQALGAAMALAEQLNQRAPNVLASIKDLVNDAGEQALSKHLGSERDHFVKNLRHANAGEGISAFLAKRKPTYR